MKESYYDLEMLSSRISNVRKSLTMSKEKLSKKNSKKPATKNLKEKRAAKAETGSEK
jgi:hypothetical protein